MRRLVLGVLSLCCLPAHGDELLCFTVSTITLTNMGQQVEHEVTDPAELRHVEHYTAFDLAGLTSSWFWEDSDGSRHREVVKLRKIGERLYVSEDTTGPGARYTTYHFADGLAGGLLVEADYIASFSCEAIGLEAAEKQYDMPFSTFESLVDTSE